MQIELSPGVFVEAPEAPEWGLGQVQTVVGTRVTVNFEHRGKVVLDVRTARLVQREETDGPLHRN